MFPGHPGDYETNAGTRYMPRGKATHSVDRPGTGSEAAWADATPGSAQPGPPAIQPCRKGLWSRWGLEQPRNHPHLHGHRPVFLHSPGQWSLALGRAVPILSAPAAPQQKSPQQWGALLICAEPQRPAHTPPAPVSRCWSQVRAPAAPAPSTLLSPRPAPFTLVPTVSSVKRYLLAGGCLTHKQGCTRGPKTDLALLPQNSSPEIQEVEGYGGDGRGPSCAAH